MRIYTVIPKALGHISTWPDKLPHVFSGATDMILLQPITKEGPSRSPYAADDYFTLNKDVADSIDQVMELGLKHGVGIGVDLVFNHIHPKSRMAQEHPDWVERRPDGSMQHAGYHWQGNWFEWHDLVRWDFGNQEVQDMLLDYVDIWSSVPHETGGVIRLDNLHSSDEAFTRKALSFIDEYYPNAHILGEYFGDESQLPEYRKMGVDSFLATQWYEPFCYETRKLLDQIHASGVQRFLPLSSHDSPPPPQVYGDVRSTLPRYAISALMGNGPYGITMWDEFGHPEKIAFIGDDIPKEPKITMDFREYFQKVDDYAKDFTGKPAFSGDGHAIIDVERGDHRAFVNLDTQHDRAYAGLLVPPCGVVIDGTMFSVKRGKVLEDRL